MSRISYAVARARQAAAALFNPWREARELRAENEHLANILANPYIEGIKIGKGEPLAIEAQSPGFAMMAGMFMGAFEKAGAKNYIEATFGSPEGNIVVTACAPSGRTPHELRMAAERRATRAQVDAETAAQDAAETAEVLRELVRAIEECDPAGFSGVERQLIDARRHLEDRAA